MVRPALTLGVGGALLSLGLIVGTGATSAQGTATTARHHGQYAPVRGVVTAVTSGSLQVQTQSGSVSVTLTTATHVIRIVTGSGADLTPNTRVDLHLVQGTTTVDAVRIDQNEKSHAAAPIGTTTHTRSGANRSSTAKPRTHTGTRTNVSGQIATVSGNTITIRSRNGQTATYTLASNVSITKVVAGKTSDLAVGETVQIVRTSSNAAAAVTILKT